MQYVLLIADLFMPYECSILDVLVKVSERDGERGKEREGRERLK